MSEYDDMDETPLPTGELVLQALAMPTTTNADGDVYAGWLMSQMDLGGSVMAQNIARGKVTTVATESMVFLRPVPVGGQVRFYAEALEVGRSSIKALVEVWLKCFKTDQLLKVTEGEFVYVAIDENGRTRPIAE